MRGLLTSVAVPVPLYRSFDYRVHAEDAIRLRPGMRVRVTFGRRKLTGVVVRAPFEQADDGQDYRPIDAVLDETPLLDPDLLALCEWAAEYYRHPLGEVVAAALPGSLKHQGEAGFAVPQQWRLSTAGQAALEKIPERHRAQRAALEALRAGPRGGGEWSVEAGVRARLVEQGWV
ncbi:MAG: primosomal protein N', partial [Solimonas sp.]